MSEATRPGRSNDRCILWRPRSQEPDAELLGALQRRSLTVTVCESPYAAMAALCEKTAGVLVLLLVDPQGLALAPQVVEAMKRYASHAPVWAFDSRTRRLRALAPQDLHAEPPPIRSQPVRSAPVPAEPARTEPKVATARPAAPAAPQLKLAGEGPLPRALEGIDDPVFSSGNQPLQPARHVLTDEELAMLLSPGPIRGNA